MNDKQVLKLALEALETVVVDVKTTPTAYEIQRQAITAIKEALAQPEQEPVAWLGLDLDNMAEAFYRVIEEHHSRKYPFHDPVNRDAMIALRELRGLIAYMKRNTTPPQRKPEQESDDLTIAYMAGFHAGKNKDAPQPEQEPVAMRYDYDGYGWLYIDNGSGSNWREKIKNAEPLFTAPPKREWIGLTEEERDHFEGLHLYAARNQVEAWIEGVPAFIDAIEAKLREKNGG